jgi:hypothetical protein
MALTLDFEKQLRRARNATLPSEKDFSANPSKAFSVSSQS